MPRVRARRAASARRPGRAGRGGPPCRAPSARPRRAARRRARRRAPAGARRASRPPRASRPSHARSPAPRGRTCAAAPPARGGTPATPRRRRRRCRARPRAAPAPRRPRRRRRPPGRPRCRRPSTRGRPAATQPGSSASSTSALQRRLPTSKRSVPEASEASIDRSAGEPQADVVLREQDVPGTRPHVRLVAPHPQQLRRGEPGQRAVAGQLDQTLEADPLLDLGALGRGAAVVPEDRRPQHALVAVEQDEPVHLPGEAERRRLHAEVGEGPCAASHQSSGSCSAQPGRGVESGYSRSARATTSPSGETASALTPLVPTSSPTSVTRRGRRTRARTPGPRPFAPAPRGGPARRFAPPRRR